MEGNNPAVLSVSDQSDRLVITYCTRFHETLILLINLRLLLSRSFVHHYIDVILRRSNYMTSYKKKLTRNLNCLSILLL